jgi:hypothetical protein
MMGDFGEAIGTLIAVLFWGLVLSIPFAVIGIIVVINAVIHHVRII